MRLSESRLNFGIVKQGLCYQRVTVLSNGLAKLRWRVEGATQVVKCVTTPNTVAPGLAKKLVFELKALETGAVALEFKVVGHDGQVARIDATATVLDANDFKAHVCRSRFERKPVFARGVHVMGRLRHYEPEDDDLLATLVAKDDDLALLPHFPACVYDPGTQTLTMDLPQLIVDVDPTVSLEDAIARHNDAAQARMRVLESAGFVTSRVLVAPQKDTS